MGINLVISCDEHRVYGYSMRGEESADLQWWFREHKPCFEHGSILIHRDCDNYPRETDGYQHAWEHEQRPFVLAALQRNR